MIKICSKCKKEKPLLEFYKDKSHKSGYRCECKECKKKYLKDNFEMISIKKKIYRSNHSEEISKYNKEYRIKNVDKILEKDKIRYSKDKEKILERSRRWKKNNHKKVREYHNKYNKERKKNDLEYKILTALRKNIYDSLKRNKKSKSTIKLLGCTIKEFRKWLKSQFDENMSWDNYGSYWHVDHILPCAAFQLQHSEEQEICFHYTNLRPLEARENLSKKDKIL